MENGPRLTARGGGGALKGSLVEVCRQGFQSRQQGTVQEAK